MTGCSGHGLGESAHWARQEARGAGVIAFLDTEFTDLLEPQLLSLGLVALDGREHYCELDLTTVAGRARVRASSDFVRYGGVLDLWGLVPGAACTEWEIGQRTGEWLLALAGESGARVEIAFDYSADFELLEYAIRDAGLWERVRDVVLPVNVASVTGGVDGGLAAEACYREIVKRGLKRHHALADALALRAAYLRIKDTAARLARLVSSGVFGRLVHTASAKSRTPGDVTRIDGWLRQWLATGSPALKGQRPLDVAEEPGGAQRLEGLLGAMAHGGSP
jgi:uncharacterized protein (DUF2384 family)